MSGVVLNREKGGGAGGVGGGAGGGLAGDGGRGGKPGRRRGGGGVVLALAEDALEGGAREPHEVAAGVHVDRHGLRRVRADPEGQSVVAAGGKWEGDLPVAAEAGGGTGGGGLEQVVDVSAVVLGLGEQVG